jgi:hypothetical protein
MTVVRAQDMVRAVGEPGGVVRARIALVHALIEPVEPVGRCLPGPADRRQTVEGIIAIDSRQIAGAGGVAGGAVTERGRRGAAGAVEAVAGRTDLVGRNL